MHILLDRILIFAACISRAWNSWTLPVVVAHPAQKDLVLPAGHDHDVKLIVIKVINYRGIRETQNVRRFEVNN